MSGAHHRPESLLPRLGREWRRRIGPDPLALGEAQRRGKRAVPRLLLRLRRILLADAGGPERLIHPPTAIAAAQQRGCARRGESGVVDISVACEALDQRVEIRRRLAVPASFLNLSGEIGLKLGAGGGVAAGVEEREALQPLLIERRAGFSGTAISHAP